jgi:hypothetical protein
MAGAGLRSVDRLLTRYLLMTLSAPPLDLGVSSFDTIPNIPTAVADSRFQHDNINPGSHETCRDSPQ